AACDPSRDRRAANARAPERTGGKARDRPSAGPDRGGEDAPPWPMRRRSRHSEPKASELRRSHTRQGLRSLAQTSKDDDASSTLVRLIEIAVRGVVTLVVVVIAAGDVDIVERGA